MCYKYLIIFLFFYFLKITLSFEIILNVDYTLNSNYSNYECGGSINSFINNTKIYPPCNTLSDAGERARQINDGIKYYSNISIIFLIDNYISGYEIQNSSIGELKNYCYIEIKIKNNPNGVLYINGENENNTFITLIDFKSEDQSCDINQPIRLKLNNIYFKKWYNKEIISIYNKCDGNEQSNKSIQISSITTDNIDKFIYAYNLCPNNLNILISNSNFLNSFNLYRFFFRNNNNLYFNDCNFNSIQTTESIFDNRLFISFNKCNFKKINISSYDSIIYSEDNAFVSISDSVVEYSSFPFFYQQDSPTDVPEYFLKIHNLLFNNNVFLKNYYNNLFLQDYIHGIIIFENGNLNEKHNIDIDNLMVLDNNEIPINRPLIFSHSYTNLKINIKNSFISSKVFILTNVDGSIINIYQNNTIYSKVINIGKNNQINLKNSNGQNQSFFLNRLNNNCENCEINYQESISSSSISKNDDTNNGNNYNPINNNIDSNKKNLIIILPSIIGGIILISIVILVIVFKLKHNNNRNLNISNEDSNNEFKQYEHATTD